MWSGGRLLLLGFGGLGLEWGRGLGMSSTTSSSSSTRTVTSSNPAVHIPTPTPTTTTTNSYYSNTRNFHHRHHLFQFQFQFQYQFHTTPTPTTTDYSCRTTSPRSSTPSLSSSAGTNTTTSEDGDDPSNNNQINTASFVFTNKDGRKKNASTAAAEAVVSGTTARGRRLLKVREEKRKREHDRLQNYPSWAKALEDACQHDEELRAVLGDSVGNPELMRQRVEDRVRRKGRNFHKSKTGSVLAFKVSFRDFNLVDSFIWFELYGSPSDRDVDLIGSVIQSWYVMGRLGAFNSSNLQLANSSMEYNPLYDVDKGFKVIPSSFHDISDIEFQDNWGRVWVDLGTCDFFAIDVLLNCLTVLSSEYLGIQQVVFGGRRMGDWEEGMTNTEYGYKYFKI